MSKLLVIAQDQLDVPGSAAKRYKQGDIVAVYPDDYVFQAGEGLPKFWQFTVLSITDTDRSSFLEEDHDQFVPSLVTRRRKRFIDITQLSQQAQNSLAANGTATVLRIAVLGALTIRA